MTRDEVELWVRKFFENNNYYTQTDIVDSMQDGYDEIVAFSGCILKATTIPFEQNRTYYDMITTIPDYVGVFAIFNRVVNRWMQSSSVRKFAQDRPDWETAGGTPWYFSVVSHRWMAIYKKPLAASYGNMSVFYVAKAPTLSSGDSVILLPDDHITALTEYIETDLWEQQQEWTKAQNHYNSFMKNEAEVEDWAKRQRSHDRIPSLK